jgi:hypothetical protein
MTDLGVVQSLDPNKPALVSTHSILYSNFLSGKKNFLRNNLPRHYCPNIPYLVSIPYIFICPRQLAFGFPNTLAKGGSQRLS